MSVDKIYHRRVEMEQMEEVQQNQEVCMPRLGEPAPQFEAVTSFGKIKLEDFKGIKISKL